MLERLHEHDFEVFCYYNGRKADVVTLYLLPNLNAKLVPQFEKMKPGSRIVSHAWGMRGIKPRAVVQVRTSEPRERTIYLWTIPLERE